MLCQFILAALIDTFSYNPNMWKSVYHQSNPLISNKAKVDTELLYNAISTRRHIVTTQTHTSVAEIKQHFPPSNQIVQLQLSANKNWRSEIWPLISKVFASVTKIQWNLFHFNCIAVTSGLCCRNIHIYTPLIQAKQEHVSLSSARMFHVWSTLLEIDTMVGKGISAS